MEKELDIDRDKIISYYLWLGLLTCAPFVLLFGIGLILAGIYYAIHTLYMTRWVKVLRYCLDDKALRVESGLLFKSRKTIPLDKITDLELVQGPLLRALGMWTVNVQTASTASGSPEATLVGLVLPEHVREEILAAKTAYLKSS